MRPAARRLAAAVRKEFRQFLRRGCLGSAGLRQRSRRRTGSGDPVIDQKIREFLDDPAIQVENEDRLQDILETAFRMARTANRGEMKLVSRSLRELGRSFRVFAPYRGVRKVSIFGSARTPAGDPSYAITRDFAYEIASRGWMVITGAGPGIMAAGHEGAGKKNSFGVGIMLPFEQAANTFISGDPKLIDFKYFFTRKIAFMKESDAFVLCPGGFGTLDEAFELLTLMQTGKTAIRPVVLLDPPAVEPGKGPKRKKKLSKRLSPRRLAAQVLGIFRGEQRKAGEADPSVVSARRMERKRQNVQHRVEQMKDNRMQMFTLGTGIPTLHGTRQAHADDRIIR